MTWYVVVTRDRHRTPVSWHVTIEDAGNKIHRERRFNKWTVLAVDGRRQAGPARPLYPQEQLRFEKTLYPGLYE